MWLKPAASREIDHAHPPVIDDRGEPWRADERYESAAFLLLSANRQAGDKVEEYRSFQHSAGHVRESGNSRHGFAGECAAAGALA